MKTYVDLKDIHVLAPNLKKRLSGVTSTIVNLVPKQKKLGVKIASIGPGLPDFLPHVGFHQLWKLWQTPNDGKMRVWHARRNVEMLPGIIMRDILRMKIKVIFTSDAQRHHRNYTKWLISKMDHVISGSEKAGNFLERESTIIHHGVDLDRFFPSHDKAQERSELGLDPKHKIAGCFGRVRHQKGTDIFVDMMIKLLPQHPEWIAVITGRVTAEHVGFADKLKKNVQDAGLADRIIFAGEVDDIEKWFRVLDLYIAPQRNEGFGLTPLEAAACNVPSVATNAGAFAELIVDNKTGIVVEVEDVDALCFHADKYMADAELLKTLGQNAREYVGKNFSLEKEATAINSVYEAVRKG
jgi:mannosyltransferase